MKRLAISILIIGALLAILSGCGQSPNKQILGKWSDGSGSTMEFFEDGTVNIFNPTSSFPNSGGKWKILEDGRLKIDMSFLGISQSFVSNIKFEKGEMIWYDKEKPASKPERLKKVKT